MDNSNPPQQPQPPIEPQPTPPAPQAAPEAPAANFAPLPETPAAPTYDPTQAAPVAPAPGFAPVSAAAPAVAAQDPGKTLGIVGFIFAFIGLQLVGLILSILGFNKSKKAGHKNTLAFAGIILNAIGIVTALIVIPFFFLTTMVAYNGISERANTSAGKAAAAQVQKYSELYYADNGTYPTAFSQLENVSTTVQQSTVRITSKPTSSSTVEFYSCGAVGNKIGYWDYETSAIAYTYSGTADETSTCSLTES
ncbi:MAG: DUF4190 domain-containing protein [Candidatus Microsaccharimonas sp.]